MLSSQKVPVYIRVLNLTWDVAVIWAVFILFFWISGRPLDYGAKLILIYCYYFIPEYYSGKTVGKLITGTKVVSADGSQPTIKQSLLRTAIRFIPLEPLTFIWGGNAHDDGSKTQLVYSKIKYSEYLRRESATMKTKIAGINNIALIGAMIVLVTVHTLLYLNKGYEVAGYGKFSSEQYRLYLQAFDSSWKLWLSQNTRITYLGLPSWILNFFYIGYPTLLLLLLRRNRNLLA